jgi:hypothetical protein
MNPFKKLPFCLNLHCIVFNSGNNFLFDFDVTPIKIFCNVRYKKLVSQTNCKWEYCCNCVA